MSQPANDDKFWLYLLAIICLSFLCLGAVYRITRQIDLDRLVPILMPQD